MPTIDHSAAFADAARYFPTPLQQFQFFDKYSRFDYDLGRRETWPETVDRSVSYLAELAPALSHWLSTEGRRSILSMSALPSMRLIAMGGAAARRQNLSIYNCSYLPVDDLIAFVEMLTISMSGCGVGFSVESQFVDKLPLVKEQTGHIADVHVVEDSTEGWAAALALGLSTWYDGGDVGFDYSRVRAAGSPLRVKGGRASGPQPLRKLLAFVRKTILSRQGHKLRPIDAHDIACAVGGAAVSGGMRRTAMISLYDQGDVDMRTAKHGKFPDIRWNANNSEVWRRDPSDLDVMQQMTTMFASQNGEPGIFSGAAAMRTMPAARRAMWPQTMQPGVNPCLTGESLVAVADGRGHVAIKQLAEEGADVPVYCLNNHEGVSIRIMRNPRVTGYSVPVVRVLLDDGSSIRVTPNHKFRTLAGNYVEAAALQPGDALGVLVKEASTIKDIFPKANSNSQTYWWLKYAARTGRMEHRYIADFNFGPIPRGYVVHHIDFDAKNNHPNNLRVMSKADHDHLHRAGMLGDNNPMRRAQTEWSPEKWADYRSKQQAASEGENNPRYLGVTNDALREHALILSRQLGHRFTVTDWYPYAEANKLPVQFSKWRKDHFGGILGLAKWAALTLGFEHIDLDGRVRRTYENLTKEGYNCQITKGLCEILKKCEVCGTEFAISAHKREVGLCSRACSAKRNWDNPSYVERVFASSKAAFKKRKTTVREGQMKVYNDLKFALGRPPLKKEWVEACKAADLTSEISRVSSPFRKFADLIAAASDLNHRVISVTPDGVEDVYNGTVDEFHNFFSGGFGDPTAVKPRFVYVNSRQCGEVLLRPQGLCNLSIAVARADDTVETLIDKVRAAAVFGTIQSTATHFPGLRPQWRENCEAERLLGVDVTGQMDCPLLTGSSKAEVFTLLQRHVIEQNHETAELLGINPAAASTVVKPGGNSSSLLDCASGLAARHSPYYVRNVRVDGHSPVYRVLRDAGAPLSPENGQTAENATTWVCGFPVKAPDGAVVKADLSALDQLEHWYANKTHWTNHNPSCTITYRPDEMIAIVAWLAEHREVIGGLSFLPASDAAYEQMPYTEIDQSEYERRLAAFPAIDWSRIVEHEQVDQTTASQELACTGDRCEI